jgi:hypothetical protein
MLDFELQAQPSPAVVILHLLSTYNPIPSQLFLSQVGSASRPPCLLTTRNILQKSPCNLEVSTGNLVVKPPIPWKRDGGLT